MTDISCESADYVILEHYFSTSAAIMNGTLRVYFDFKKVPVAKISYIKLNAFIHQ